MENNQKQGCGCGRRHNDSSKIVAQSAPNNDSSKIVTQSTPIVQLGKNYLPNEMNQKQEALVELIRAVHARKGKISNRFQK